MKGVGIVITLYSFGICIVNCQNTSPLCDSCICTTLQTQKITINCVSVNISDVYDQKLWFDDSNNSYQIDTFILQFNNMTSLQTKFPLSNLSELHLTHNSIKDVASGIFSQLQEMVELSLAFNDIEYLHPDVFKGVYEKSHYYPLKSLKKLNLQNNKIHTFNPDTFKHIDEIQELNLSHNPIKVIDYDTLEAIASLVFLSILNLSYTGIQTLPNNFLYSPRSLTTLDLSGNEFETIPEALKYVQSLKVLHFNYNPLKNISQSNGFTYIPSLLTLYVSHMPYLETIGPKSFAGLENLQELRLCYNAHLSTLHQDAFLTYATKQYFEEKNYIPVTRLYLNNNNLTILQKELLPNWEHLQVLNLNDNPWICDCQNQWLMKDLLTNLFQRRQDLKIQCATPTNMKNKIIRDKNVGIANCSYTWILITIICGLFFIFLIAVVCICKKRVTRKFTPIKFEPVPTSD